MKEEKQNGSTLKWLLREIKPQIGSLIFIILLTCLLGTVGSVTALIVGHLVDSAVSADWQGLVAFSVSLALVYLFNVILQALSKYLTARCKNTLEMGLRRKFFDCALKKEYSSIAEYHSGELMNRITSDVSLVTNMVTDVVPQCAGLLTKLVFAVVMILYIQPILALIYVVGGFAVFFAVRIFREKIKKYHKKAQKSEDAVRSFWQENLSNLLGVKVFAAQDNMGEKSDKLQSKWFKAKMKSTKFNIISSTGYLLMLSLGYAFATIWCGVCLYNKIITFGTLTTIVKLVGQIQSPFTGMSGMVTQYYTAAASAERLIEIENLQNEELIEYIEPQGTYNNLRSIDFCGVDFSYDRDNVLEKFDLSVKKGEFLGIIGNSGIGKSTLFKLILGVFKPQKGSIMLNMTDGNIPCDASARKLFAYVPQGNMLFSGTIKENITLINDLASDDEIERAVKLSCCDDFVYDLPDGLECHLGEKGMGLSEGQIQRIAIARALVSGAPILLFDEATSALDAETEERLLNNLRHIDGVTCIIVTHRLKALSICDRTIKIENGSAITQNSAKNT